MGWRHTIELREGIERTYRWLVEHEAEALAGLRVRVEVG